MEVGHLSSLDSFPAKRSTQALEGMAMGTPEVTSDCSYACLRSGVSNHSNLLKRLVFLCWQAAGYHSSISDLNVSRRLTQLLAGETDRSTERPN